MPLIIDRMLPVDITAITKDKNHILVLVTVGCRGKNEQYKFCSMTLFRSKPLLEYLR